MQIYIDPSVFIGKLVVSRFSFLLYSYIKYLYKKTIFIAVLSNSGKIYSIIPSLKKQLYIYIYNKFKYSLDIIFTY